MQLLKPVYTNAFLICLPKVVYETRTTMTWTEKAQDLDTLHVEYNSIEL